MLIKNAIMFGANPEISLVGTPQSGTSNSGADVVLTFSTPLQETDVVIVWGGAANGNPLAPDFPGVATAGYLTAYNQSGMGSTFGVFYKRMGPSPDSSVTCHGTENPDRGAAWGCYVLRGVHSDIFDAAATSANSSGSTNPDPASITTVTPDAWVIVCAVSTDQDTSVTAPTGYINPVHAAVNDSQSATIAGATKLIATPGAENPASWTNWSSGAWRAVTLAIKPG